MLRSLTPWTPLCPVPRLLVGAPNHGLENLGYGGAVFEYQGVANADTGLYEYGPAPTRVLEGTRDQHLGTALQEGGEDDS